MNSEYTVEETMRVMVAGLKVIRETPISKQRQEEPQMEAPPHGRKLECKKQEDGKKQEDQR